MDEICTTIRWACDAGGDGTGGSIRWLGADGDEFRLALFSGVYVTRSGGDYSDDCDDWFDYNGTDVAADVAATPGEIHEDEIGVDGDSMDIDASGGDSIPECGGVLFPDAADVG